MNQYSEKYFTNTSTKGESVLKFYIDFLRKNVFELNYKNVLDIGCATGNLYRLIDKNSNYFGLDISKHAISICKTKFRNISRNFKQIDINTEYPNYPIKFDIIAMFDVVEHLNNFSILKEIFNNYLKEEGFLVLTTPNANSILRFVQPKLFTGEIDNTHQILFTPYTLDFFLRKSNFEQVRLTAPFSFMKSSDFISKNILLGGQIFAIYKKSKK